MRQFILALAAICGFAVPGSAGEIVVIVGNPSNPFAFIEADYARRAAHEAGHDVDIFSHGGLLELERQLIARAIESEADAILLDPADYRASHLNIELAARVGVPVFVVNQSIDHDDLVQRQYVADNVACARISAEKFAELMHYKGRYIRLDGATIDSNAEKRRRGFQEVMDKYPDIELVGVVLGNWSRERSFTEVRRLIDGGLKFDGILAANDEMALGAYSAIRSESDAHDIVIAGFDGSPEAVKSIWGEKIDYTILQPVIENARSAIAEIDSLLATGVPLAGEKTIMRGCEEINLQNASRAVDVPFMLEPEEKLTSTGRH